MTTPRKKTSPQARPGNRNAAKPAKDRRVVLVAQRVDPATLAYLQQHGPSCGGIGRLIDACVIAFQQLQGRIPRG